MPPLRYPARAAASHNGAYVVSRAIIEQASNSVLNLSPECPLRVYSVEELGSELEGYCLRGLWRVVFGFERWLQGLFAPFVLLGRHEMPYWWFRDEPIRHSS